LDSIINRAEEARKANPGKKIAVAFSVFHGVMRDYIRKNLSEPVSFVQIAVTKEEYVERAMPRVRDFCKATGNTEE
jgi:hypothetical protein